MSTLYDSINKNHALKQLYKYLEFGFNTSLFNFLLLHLKDFTLDCEMMAIEHIVQLQKRVADDMISHNFSRRDIVEMSNVLAVYGLTAIAVQSTDISDKEIDASWAAKYFDCVKNINGRELQSLWSKLLAIELKQPNTFFKRTLDVFSKADAFEIDWYFEVTKYVFDKACIPEFILSEKGFYPFNQFQTLIDAGFVNASRGNISYNEPTTIRLSSANIEITMLNPSVILSVYTLTDAGSQLFDLSPKRTTDEFLGKMKEFLERNNRASVTINKLRME